jgi:triosephosphate isomerase
VNKKVIIGNLKMHGSLDFNEKIFNAFSTEIDCKNIDVGVCVPYPYLFQAKQILKGSGIAWGAQNVAKDEIGPFTGEVGASMISEFGSSFVIIGHSERSTAYCESDENIAEKFKIIKKYDMVPILCVGETLIEREAGMMKRVVSSQLKTLLSSSEGASIFKGSLIAYEPVWAIGTDIAASPEQAQEMCGFIQEEIVASLSSKEEKNTLKRDLKILYGGSVNAQNTIQLLSSDEVGGVLVGRGSVNQKEFINICNNANKLYV